MSIKSLGNFLIFHFKKKLFLLFDVDSAKKIKRNEIWSGHLVEDYFIDKYIWSKIYLIDRLVFQYNIWSKIYLLDRLVFQYDIWLTHNLINRQLDGHVIRSTDSLTDIFVRQVNRTTHFIDRSFDWKNI